MNELRQVVIVGAGLAGLRAAETLRREGFDGRIALIGDEIDPPYDRPPLSKEVLTGERAPESVALATPERLAALDVELVLGQPATALDLEERTIGLAAATMPFDGLIIATGAAPRRLAALETHPRARTLRTLEDSLHIREGLRAARHVTVIGAGFIGSEVAASARSVGCAVTVVELEQRPLSRLLGSAMSSLLMELHRDRGTDLRLGVTVEAVDGDRLRLTDGTVLQTDLVVVGVGVVPNIGWLDGSGLDLSQGIVCDGALQAGAPGVFAVGDVASWPNPLFEARVRFEHWTTAVAQARHAARNLVRGERAPFVDAGYVWSDQYGLRIQIVGLTLGEDVVVVSGSVDERRFVAWYRDADRLVGALGIGMPQLTMRTKALIEQRVGWDDALAAVADAV